MATYKGIGFDNTSGKVRTGTASDDISFASQITATDGVAVTGLTSTTTLSTTGDASIGGDLSVVGDIISRGEVDLVIQDPVIDLGIGNTTTTAQAGGYSLTMNRNSGFTAETVIGATAGDAGAPSAPVLVMSSATSFAIGDVLCYTGSAEGSNDGLYCVSAVSGANVTLEGVGGTAISGSMPFLQNQVTTITSGNEAAGARAFKIDIYAQLVADGTNFAQGGGAQFTKGTLIEKFQANAVKSDFTANGSYQAVGSAALTTSLQDAYNNGNSITTASSADIDFNLASGNLAIDQGSVILGGSNATNFTMDGGSFNAGGSTTLNDFAVQTNGNSGQDIILSESGASGSIAVAVNSGTVLEAKSGGLDLNTDISFGKASGSQQVLTKLSTTAGDDLKIALTGANNASIILDSAGTGNDAISLNASAGGFDLAAATDSKIVVTTGALEVGTDTSGDLTLSTTTAGAIVANSAEAIDLNAPSGAITADGATVSIDATGNANLTATGGNLVVSTVTSGELDLTSAGLLDINAGANLDIDVTGTYNMLSTGTFTIAGTGSSSITATSGDLTLQNATSGGIVINSLGTADIFSDDALTIQMDANDNSPIELQITANNAGTGDAIVVIDADNVVKLTQNGTDKLIANANGINLGTGVSVNTILDEDNLGSDSATALATQQSIKAYVDSQVSSSDLDFVGDTGGAQSVDLDTETFSILGTTNEIETAGSAQTITIGLPAAVAITTSLNVGSTFAVTGFVDDDTFGSASATTLPSSESVKAYVDTSVAGVDQTLEIEGDSGTGAVNLATGVLDVAGTANQIVTAASGTDITVALTDAITVVTSLTSPLLSATNVQNTNYKANDGTAAMTIADTTGAVAVSTTLGLASGTTINEFSTDETLAGNSDNAVPTEKAVKAFVEQGFQGLTVLNDGSGGSLAAGQVVAINGSGNAIQADADVSANAANVIGVCVINDSGTIYVQQSGNNTSVSGLVAGTKYYLSKTAGGLTATAPSAAGEIVYQIGFARSATELVVVPQFIMEIG